MNILTAALRTRKYMTYEMIIIGHVYFVFFAALSYELGKYEAMAWPAFFLSATSLMGFAWLVIHLSRSISHDPNEGDKIFLEQNFLKDASRLLATKYDIKPNDETYSRMCGIVTDNGFDILVVRTQENKIGFGRYYPVEKGYHIDKWQDEMTKKELSLCQHILA